MIQTMGVSNMDKQERFNENGVTNGDDLLGEAYCQFELSLTTYGKFKKNFKIKAKVRHLEENLRLNHDDILHELLSRSLLTQDITDAYLSFGLAQPLGRLEPIIVL